MYGNGYCVSDVISTKYLIVKINRGSAFLFGCVVAATSMKWIKAKMEELGMLTSSRYSLSFMVDSLAMITIDTGEKYGVIEVRLDNGNLFFAHRNLAVIILYLFNTAY